MKSGTYIVRCGPTFYVGSSSNLKARRLDHRWRLRRGIHQNQKLQEAYTKAGEMAFVTVGFLNQQDGESVDDFRGRLRCAEQKILDFYAGDKGLANKSTSALGPDNGSILRKKWEEPEYREHMAQVMRDRGPASEESKAKMSEAKRGVRNPKSRKVEVTCPDGKKTILASVTEAAEFFKVSQQLMDLWMRGKVSWPGTGRQRPAADKQWIVGYSARVV